MTNDGILDDEPVRKQRGGLFARPGDACLSFCHSVIRISSVIRHSSFVIRHFTLSAILVSSAFDLTFGPPLAAQVQPPPGFLRSEVKIAGANEWVEVVSNSASGVDLARYSIELRDVGGSLRPDSLFPLIDNREGKEKVLRTVKGGSLGSILSKLVSAIKTVKKPKK